MASASNAARGTEMMYVVYTCEHLRDETIEIAKVFNTKQAALEWIDKRANGFAGDNHTFRLFELGKEIVLKTEDVMEPQPAKKVKRSVVEDGASNLPKRKK